MTILEIFEQVLKMAFMGTFVILAVFLARALMSRFPKKCVYALWLIVGLRLVCPATVYSPISLFNLDFAGTIQMPLEAGWDAELDGKSPAEYDSAGDGLADQDSTEPEKFFTETLYPENTSNGSVAEKNISDEKITGENYSNGSVAGKNISDKNVSEKNTSEIFSVNPGYDLPEQTATGNHTETSDRMVIAQAPDFDGDESPAVERVLSVLSAVWLVGMGLLILWNMILTFRMKKRLKKAVRYRDNIYESDCIPTPFVMGLIRPRIYIPFRLSEQERDYILRHEQYHIRRRDYIVKVVAFLITAVYWFHPLVWAAYFSMIRDMEMSCDEQILWESGEDIRKNYSMSLLAFATNKRQYSMDTLAFGETNTKKRVRHIMKCKKKGKWMSVCAVLLFALLGTACLTSRKDGGQATNSAGDGQTAQADQDGQRADAAKAERAISVEEFLRQGIQKTMPMQVAEQLEPVKCRTAEGDGSEITYLFGNGGEGGEDTLRLDFTYKDGALVQYVSKEYGYLDALSESIGEVWHDPAHTEKDLEKRSIELIQEFEKAFLKVNPEDDSQYKKLKTPARYQGDILGESYRLFKNTVSGDTYVVCLFYDMVVKYDAAGGRFSRKNAVKIAYKDYATPNNEWEYCNIPDFRERKMMTQLMDAALTQPEDPGYETLRVDYQKNLKSQKECGFSLYYKGKYWAAYDGGYLVGEDGNILYSAKLSSFSGAILRKTVDFSPVKPKDFSGISEASLVYVPKEVPERDHKSLKITDEKELAMIEQAFSHAEYVRGGSDCPMGEIRLWLYRSKIAKKELIVTLAGDGCPMFRVGGITYRYDDSKFSDSLKKKLHSYDATDSDKLVQEDKTDSKTTVRLVMTKGGREEDELSPYHGMLTGSFRLEACQNGKITGKKAVNFGDEELYFPEKVKIHMKDYNGDGRADFALGQQAGSNYKEYQFYTVTEAGKIEKLSVNGEKSETLTASSAEYSPAFKVKDGKVQFEYYDMENGKYVQSQAVIQ